MMVFILRLLDFGCVFWGTHCGNVVWVGQPNPNKHSKFPFLFNNFYVCVYVCMEWNDFYPNFILFYFIFCFFIFVGLLLFK
jgi:hypothetical protein